MTVSARTEVVLARSRATIVHCKTTRNWSAGSKRGSVGQADAAEAKEAAELAEQRVRLQAVEAERARLEREHQDRLLALDR